MDQSKRRSKRPRSASLSEGQHPEFDTPSVKMATLYDAVEGAMTQSGFFGPKVAEQRRATQSLRPDEVLFKKRNAPTRYQETDYYFAHRHLPQDRKLPDGDFLKALHGYITKLYSRTHEPGQKPTWRCMDETALIALGILLEETVVETIGETGDLALIEAALDDEENAFAAQHDESENASSGQSSDSED